MLIIKIKQAESKQKSGGQPYTDTSPYEVSLWLDVLYVETKRQSH